MTQEELMKLHKAQIFDRLCDDYETLYHAAKNRVNQLEGKLMGYEWESYLVAQALISTGLVKDTSGSVLDFVDDMIQYLSDIRQAADGQDPMHLIYMGKAYLTIME